MTITLTIGLGNSNFYHIEVIEFYHFIGSHSLLEHYMKSLNANTDILYTPLFSRTVIFAVLARCGNSRVVNFAI